MRATNCVMLFLLIAYFSGLIAGALVLMLSPLFVMLHIGFWWGVVAMWAVWPLAYTIFLL